MFSENDVDDNNASMRSRKRKPKFELVGEDLVLTGTPIAKAEAWAPASLADPQPESRREGLQHWLLQSHALHDAWFRYEMQRDARTRAPRKAGKRAERERPELALTNRILGALAEEVAASGAELVVFFIPSRREFTRAGTARPYQREIAAACRELGIATVDLAPAFGRSGYRTYYRGGGHWTARGHQVAADAMREPLRRALQP